MSTTVKVRIAVAVDPDGDWNACGWSSATDKTARDLATETVGEGEAVYWLEAELPVPATQVVQATVTLEPTP